MSLAHGGYDFWFFFGAFLQSCGGFLVALTVLAGVIFILSRQKWGMAVPNGPSGLCWKCSYDQRGLTSSRCPECGEWIVVPVRLQCKDCMWFQDVAPDADPGGERCPFCERALTRLEK